MDGECGRLANAVPGQLPSARRPSSVLSILSVPAPPPIPIVVLAVTGSIVNVPVPVSDLPEPNATESALIAKLPDVL